MDIFKLFFFITIIINAIYLVEKDKPVQSPYRMEKNIFPEKDPYGNPTDTPSNIKSIYDLNGYWKLTHAWIPNVGWIPSRYSSMDFYNYTFYHYANQWDIKDTTMKMSTNSQIGNASNIYYECKDVNIGKSKSTLHIEEKFKYKIWLLRKGNALIVHALNKENENKNLFHWFTKK